MSTSTMPDFDADRVLTATGRLAEFNAAGVLGAAEVHTAMRLWSLYRPGEEPDDLACLGMAIAVRALRAGAVCVDLRHADELVLDITDDATVTAPAADLVWPEAETWWAALMGTGLVDDADAPDSGAPLRRRGELLYAARHFADEEVLRHWLEDPAQQADHDQTRAVPSDQDRGPADSAPAATATSASKASSSANLDALHQALAELFPGGQLDDGEPDQQRLAAATAALGSRLVLAGGPGTGKTRTVARLLAVLNHLHRQAGHSEPLQIALAAPTGKAAARLTESIAEAREQLPEQWAELIAPARVPAAKTLHLLLEARFGRFDRNASNPLPHDVVVVDEMSMVSLSMMARLLAALRPDARLICVGDPDQLASVEAGAVMADITAAEIPTDPELTGGLATLAAPAHPFAEPLRPPVVRLQRTFRFEQDIAALAAAIRQGEVDDTLTALRSGGDITFTEVDPATADDPVLAPVREQVVAHGHELHRLASAGAHAEALAVLDQHRLLCAHRRGPWGVATWEARMREWLGEIVAPGQISAQGQDDWYVGMPLINTRNQRDVNLANGDTGVVVESQGSLRGAFGIGSQPQLYSTLVLDSARPMHAMTVHKSQGSQFDHLTLILPPPESPVLTRELLYTAVTRAKQHVHVIGTEAAVRRAVTRPANRASGLGRGR